VVPDALNQRVARVAAGGAILDEIKMRDGFQAFACGLGGNDGTTLMIATALDFDPTQRARRCLDGP
jgi:hypothetical protein